MMPDIRKISARLWAYNKKEDALMHPLSPFTSAAEVH